MFNISNPQDFPIRPLNKGMILNLPTQVVPPDACVDASNYIVTEVGPTRRPSWEVFSNIECPFTAIELFTFWTSELGVLAQEGILITDGPLYGVGVNGTAELVWNYTEGTVNVTAGVVTGTGTTFVTNNIYPGDVLIIDGVVVRIASVNTELSLTLREEPDMPDTIGSVAYEIKRCFNDSAVHLADYAIVDNQLVITSFNKPIIYYDPASTGDLFGMYIDDDAYKIDSGSGPEDFVCNCLAYFQGRLFVGYTLENTEGLRRQRLRWSTATNPRDFSRSEAYLDLPYQQGALRRLVPLANTLVAYFDDAIYIGVPTNNPLLPLAFQRIETGGVGLAGMKAVAPFVDGHFFVGNDDIYFLSQRGPERLGSPVIKKTIKECDHLERIYASLDIEHDRVVFGFPKSGIKIEELWSFNYKSKAWSYERFSTYMISNPLMNLTLSWSDLLPFTWDNLEDSYPSWDVMQSTERDRSFYVENAGRIIRTNREGAQDHYFNAAGDPVTEPINAAYETGDFDMDQPDVHKTFLRLSMKLDFQIMPSENIPFSVQASWNRGRNWENIGPLIIERNFDEGYCNFLISSSHVRFRITTNAIIEPFTITEIVVRARLRGNELTVGAQSP